jgi:hypothetical protein
MSSIRPIILLERSRDLLIESSIRRRESKLRSKLFLIDLIHIKERSRRVSTLLVTAIDSR